MKEKGTEYVDFPSVASEYENAKERAKKHGIAKLEKRGKKVTNISFKELPPTKNALGVTLLQGCFILEWEREVESIEEGKMLDAEADYQEGLELMQKKCYLSASKYFEKHLDYKDSEELYNKCKEGETKADAEFWRKDKIHTRIIAAVIIAIIVLFVFLVANALKNNGSDGNPLTYILAVALIIGGIIALIVDGKNHGLIYVIGEIVMVVLLIAFG